MIKTPNGLSIPGKDLEMGTKVYKNVSLVDIFPTLTELCGLPAKKDITGRSLVPLLGNDQYDWNDPVVTVFGDKHFSIRKDQWHYILYDGGGEELYNLEKDPEEWTNIAADTQYETLTQELKGYIPRERKENIKTKQIKWSYVLEDENYLYNK